MYSRPVFIDSQADYSQLSDLAEAQELEMHVFTSPDNGLSRIAVEEIRSVLQCLDREGVHVVLKEHSVNDGSSIAERMKIMAVPTTVVSNFYIVGIPTQGAVMSAIRRSLLGSSRLGEAES
jgi:ABC-type lipopolysaccharide export system ATPase subunit